MVFNSVEFLVFFAVVLGLYYFLPKNGKLALVFLASCIFYMAFVPKYILILFFLIVVDFLMGQLIERHTGRERKIFFLISLAANLLILFFFKYFNFFGENINQLAQFLNWNYSFALLRIALPIGLSFHVFQSLSYVIEVYRGKYKAERNIGIYAIYVMFFPQLVAGPIERPQHLLPQFHLEHKFNPANLTRGFELMLWGFFKKIVIADNIALLVDHTYSHLSLADGPTLLLTVVLFAYQLYCDFSGYTDIALGTALTLGYDLTNNFNRPYASRSVPEFWRRWHISLSSWLRDYLYYPLALGAGRITRMRLYLSTMITFILIGLWHGANWTFIWLGLVHGLYLVISQAIGPLPQIKDWIKVVTTFLLVSLSWVFFRAPNMHDAWFVLTNLFSNWSLSYEYLRYDLFTLDNLGIDKQALLIILVAIVALEIVQYRQPKFKTRPARYAWYYGLVASILFFGYFAAPSFIYFQF